MIKDRMNELREQFADIRREEGLPDDMTAMDYFLSRGIVGHRVAFYLNIPPSEAKRGGGVEAVARAKRDRMRQLIERVNRYRAEASHEPFEVVGEYIDTEHYRTRFVIRPEARRLLDDIRDDTVDVVLAVSQNDVASSPAQWEEYDRHIRPTFFFFVDLVESVDQAIT